MLRETTAANPERMRRALAGLRKYQEAERSPPPAPAPTIAETQGASLRDYGGDVGGNQAGCQPRPDL